MKIKTTIRAGAVNLTSTTSGPIIRYGGRGCGGGGGYPVLTQVKLA